MAGTGVWSLWAWKPQDANIHVSLYNGTGAKMAFSRMNNLLTCSASVTGRTWDMHNWKHFAIPSSHLPQQLNSDDCYGYSRTLDIARNCTFNAHKIPSTQILWSTCCAHLPWCCCDSLEGFFPDLRPNKHQYPTKPPLLPQVTTNKQSNQNQRPGLLNRIKHLLPFSARLLFYNSLVMPLFDYADLVWGDKHNVTLMTSLQVLQNKAAKIILDRPLYSSATHALATLKWVPLEKRRFQRRCIYVYKCLNGLVEHDMNFIKQQEQYQN